MESYPDAKFSSDDNSDSISKMYGEIISSNEMNSNLKIKGFITPSLPTKKSQAPLASPAPNQLLDSSPNPLF